MIAFNLLITEFYYNLRGALRLALFDAGGALDLQSDPGRAQRSFIIPLMILPLMMLLLLVDADTRKLSVVLLQGLGFIIHIAAFLLIAEKLTTAWQHTDRYLPFVTSYNSAVMIQFIMTLPLVLISATSPENTLFMHAGVLLIGSLVLAYQWFLFKTILQTEARHTFLLLAIDMFINLAVALPALMAATQKTPA